MPLQLVLFAMNGKKKSYDNNKNESFDNLRLDKLLTT